jgi:hypothetical protein
MDVKYVMFEVMPANSNDTVNLDQKMPVIFPGCLNHDVVAEYMRMLFLNHELQARPVSAGFINLGSSTTHGKSETLNLESHPDDASIINTFQYTSGIGYEREKPAKTKKTPNVVPRSTHIRRKYQK